MSSSRSDQPSHSGGQVDPPASEDIYTRKEGWAAPRFLHRHNAKEQCIPSTFVTAEFVVTGRTDVDEHYYYVTSASEVGTTGHECVPRGEEGPRCRKVGQAISIGDDIALVKFDTAFRDHPKTHLGEWEDMSYDLNGIHGISETNDESLRKLHGKPVGVKTHDEGLFSSNLNIEQTPPNPPRDASKRSTKGYYGELQFSMQVFGGEKNDKLEAKDRGCTVRFYGEQGLPKSGQGNSSQSNVDGDEDNVDKDKGKVLGIITKIKYVPTNSAHKIVRVFVCPMSLVVSAIDKHFRSARSG